MNSIDEDRRRDDELRKLTAYLKRLESELSPLIEKHDKHFSTA